MNHRIYKITNTVTGEVYIGETSQTLEKRWQNHIRATRSGRDNSLGESIKKYGEDVFVMELIQMCKKEDAVNIEEKWIAHYDSYNNGLNDAPRKYVTSKGRKLSEETREKLRKASSGKNNPMYGKDVRDFMTEEQIAQWKENMSKARKGKKLTEEQRQKRIDNPTKAKKVLQYKKGELVNEFVSLSQAWRKSGYDKSYITFRYHMLKGREIQGYFYKYAE